MKSLKKVTLVLLGALALVGCSQSRPSENKEKVEGSADRPVVYSSIFPIQDMTSKIGGDKIQAIQLVPEGVGAHDYDPTTKDMVVLEEADLLVINGMGLEAWADDLEASLANDLQICDSSQGIEPIEGHCHCHDHEHEEHDHSHSMDPHTWTSPVNMKIQAENIKNALVALDPDNKDYYEDNYQALATEFDALDKEYRDAIGGFSSKDFIVSHEAFGYMAHEYGLNQIGIEALVPESEPSPQRMAEVIDFIKDKGVKAVYFEANARSNVAEALANETGVEVLEINTLEALTDAEKANNDDYFSIMRKNLSLLEKGLK